MPLVGGAAEQQDAVGSGAEVRLADTAHPLGRELEREALLFDDHVVVAECLPFLEGDAHGGAAV